MHKYRELKVWQRAMTFTVVIYKESQKWPTTDERFGLISQIRRATTSIPLNIAGRPFGKRVETISDERIFNGFYRVSKFKIA